MQYSQAAYNRLNWAGFLLFVDICMCYLISDWTQRKMRTFTAKTARGMYTTRCIALDRLRCLQSCHSLQKAAHSITHENSKQFFNVTGEQSSWLYYSIEITITWKLLIFALHVHRTLLRSRWCLASKNFALHITWKWNGIHIAREPFYPQRRWMHKMLAI